MQTSSTISTSISNRVWAWSEKRMGWKWTLKGQNEQMPHCDQCWWEGEMNCMENEATGSCFHVSTQVPIRSSSIRWIELDFDGWLWIGWLWIGWHWIEWLWIGWLLPLGDVRCVLVMAIFHWIGFQLDWTRFEWDLDVILIRFSQIWSEIRSGFVYEWNLQPSKHLTKWPRILHVKWHCLEIQLRFHSVELRFIVYFLGVRSVAMYPMIP